MNDTCEIRDCPDKRPAIAINGHYFCLRHFRGAIGYLGFGAPEVVETLINRLQKTHKEKIPHG
ncbi:MAG: hypothetical protein ACYC63_11760 [Armatimonadota bacterium]